MRAKGHSIILWQWVILLLLLPLVLYPAGLRGLVLLVIPLFWAARKIASGHFFQTSPYDFAIMILLIMTGQSIVVSFDLEVALPKIISLLFSIALFYAVLDFGRNHSIFPIVAVFLLGGIFLSLVGLVGKVWLPPYDILNGIRSSLQLDSLTIPGTVGGTINENELAGALTWVAPLAFACFIGLGKRLWVRNKIIFLFVLIATILSCFVLIATSSRGGILAFGSGITLVIAFFIPSRWRLVISIAFATMILVGLTYFYGFELAGGDAIGDTLGLTGRVEIWSRALVAISDFPFTGVGFNSFRHIVGVLYPLFIIPSTIDLAHAHNHLLQTALDVGLPGMVSYLALWFISAGLLWSARRKLIRRGLRRHSYYALVAGLSGSMLSGWVFGMFDAIALGSRPTFLWWMLLGLIASVHFAVIFPAKSAFSHYQSSQSPNQMVEDVHVALPITTVMAKYTPRERNSKQ